MLLEEASQFIYKFIVYFRSASVFILHTLINSATLEKIEPGETSAVLPPINSAKTACSLQFMRDRCGITKEGVSLLDLSTGAESIGLRTLAIKCTIDDVVNSIPFPAIVFWKESHFVKRGDIQCFAGLDFAPHYGTGKHRPYFRLPDKADEVTCHVL